MKSTTLKSVYVSDSRNEKVASLNGGLLLGLVIFYLFSTIYAMVIFKQFSGIQIFMVSGAFATLFLFLIWVFLRKFFIQIKYAFDANSFLVAVPLAAVLVFFSNTWFSSGGPSWKDYFPAFPFHSLGSGLGFHQDSVFHAALIQSILSFGYPSTGQHGVPLVPYHVLSHYVDAVLLWVTGMEPFDSYGLLFHFKVSLFLAALVVFIWVVTRAMSAIFFFLSVIFLSPILIQDWISVGSHGLWFTSLLLILGAPYVFEIANTNSKTWIQLLGIFVFVILIGLGKVSSGLLLAALLSTLLILTKGQRVLGFVVGLGWLSFFVLYYSQFTNGASTGFRVPSISSTLAFLNFKTTYGQTLGEPNLLAIYLVLVLLIFTWVVYQGNLARNLFAAGLSGLFALTVVIQVLTGLAQPDIFYFIHGLYFPFILFGFICFSFYLSRGQLRKKNTKPLTLSRVNTILAVLLCVSIIPMKITPINPFSISFDKVVQVLKSANSGYFESFNYVEGAGKQVSILSTVSGLRTLPVDVESSVWVYNFRLSLEGFMKEEGLNKSNSYLFVSNEILGGDVSRVGGNFGWANGLLIYAVTGVPLLHGIRDPSVTAFGQSSYDSEAMTISETQINGAALCSYEKKVIVVKTLWPTKFSLIC
jgi:hypothetical protein